MEYVSTAFKCSGYINLTFDLWTVQAQQQRHERELYELQIKAEREALETQLHMEESRQRAARVLGSRTRTY